MSETQTFQIHSNSIAEFKKTYPAVVAMAVYMEDRLTWVKESIESIFAQTYQNFLFIIVIDGPIKPALKSYLDDLGDNTENLILICGEMNQGLSRCMNFIIEFVLENFPETEFMFRMDADDVAMPRRLEHQVAFLKSRPDIAVVGSNLLEINELGKQVGKRMLPNSHDQIVDLLPRRCSLNHPTTGIRMSVFQSGHRYRSELRNTQDYFLWIELANSGIKFENLQDNLLKFRRVNDFYKRRGLEKSINEFKARFHAMKTLKKMTALNVMYAVLVIFLRLMPTEVIKLAYKVDRYLLNR